MVAERAADVPRAGALADKADKVEVVLVADLVGPDRKAPLGHGEADVETAVGIPRTADELGVSPHVLDGEHAAADRAFSKVHLLGSAVADVVADAPGAVRLAAAEEAGASLFSGPFYTPVGHMTGVRRTSDEWKYLVESWQTLAPVVRASTGGTLDRPEGAPVKGPLYRT